MFFSLHDKLSNRISCVTVMLSHNDSLGGNNATSRQRPHRKTPIQTVKFNLCTKSLADKTDAPQSMERNISKSLSSPEGYNEDPQIIPLTLGLLRGLVDRPDEAPLIDRDLREHNRKTMP